MHKEYVDPGQALPQQNSISCKYTNSCTISVAKLIDVHQQGIGTRGSLKPIPESMLEAPSSEVKPSLGLTSVAKKASPNKTKEKVCDTTCI